jgi:hypothetical protein
MAELGYPLTLFADVDFAGFHKHIFLYNGESNMFLYDFNDCTSSIYIVEGQWEFYRDANLQNPYTDANGNTIVLGPFRYLAVDASNCLGPGSNDTLSSLKRVG